MRNYPKPFPLARKKTGEWKIFLMLLFFMAVSWMSMPLSQGHGFIQEELAVSDAHDVVA
jgi:hypothetical protein